MIGGGRKEGRKEGRKGLGWVGWGGEGIDWGRKGLDWGRKGLGWVGKEGLGESESRIKAL